MANDYHSRSEISRSQIVTFLESRRLYEATFVTKTVAAKEETNAMRIGTCSHLLALQPELFARTVVEIPADKLASDGSRKGNAWKDFEAQCDADGIIPLKAEELAPVKGMANALMARAGRFIRHKDAKFEYEIAWTDPETGLDLRAMLDIVIPLADRVIVLDVKTTNDVSPHKFRHKIRDFGYWCQPPHYGAAVEAEFGVPCDFVFLAVESAPPYLCRQYELCPETRRDAGEKWRQALFDLAECYRTGDWSDECEEEIVPLTVML